MLLAVFLYANLIIAPLLLIKYWRIFSSAFEKSPAYSGTQSSRKKENYHHIIQAGIPDVQAPRQKPYIKA